MKRIVVTSVGSLALLASLWSGTAASQVAPPPETTVAPTTAAPTTAPPTTDAPTTAAPTTDPAGTAPPTTVAGGTASATTAPPVSIPQVPLPGEQITSGTLTVGATFKDKTGSTCQLSGSLAGQEMNIMLDENGRIGATYGQASIGGGQVGLVMVELGPLPMAVTAFRTTGACNQDVVGIGAYDATAKTAEFKSVGYAVYPNDYLDDVRVSLSVGTSASPATLDLQKAYDFLAAPRPTS